jgi:hypothetical protein
MTLILTFSLREKELVMNIARLFVPVCCMGSPSPWGRALG